jgi:hypothetical protein
MDAAERHALIQRLGRAMSDVSEQCYCAGWLDGTEYFVPELCRRALESGRTQYWGHGEVTLELADQLVALAERVECWADTDCDSVGYIPFKPFPIPQEYIEAIEQEQSSEFARQEQRRSE